MKTATIRLGPILVGPDLSQPEKLERNRWYYHPGALRLPAGGTLLVVDHDLEQPVGRVHELYETRDDEGRAVYCRATITDEPRWLRERYTAASVSFVEEDGIALGRGAVLYMRGELIEISLRSPSGNPARDRSARITHLETIEEPWKPVAMPTKRAVRAPRTATPAGAPSRQEWRAEIHRRIDAAIAAYGEDVDLSPVFTSYRLELGLVAPWKV